MKSEIVRSWFKRVALNKRTLNTIGQCTKVMTTKQRTEIFKLLHYDNAAMIEAYKKKEISFKFLLKRIEINCKIAIKNV